MRLAQYVLLGVGGVRALRALGIEPGVDPPQRGPRRARAVRARRAGAALGRAAVDGPRRGARAHRVHHPHAGARRQRHLPRRARSRRRSATSPSQLGIDAATADRARPDAIPTTRTSRSGSRRLALRMSRAANGVSRRHGEVAREMWQPLWPERAVDDVPDRPRHQRRARPDLDGGADARAARPPPRRGLAGARGRARRRGRRSTRSPTPSCGQRARAAARRAGRRTSATRSVDRPARARRRARVRRGRRARRSIPTSLTIGFARRVATYKRLDLLTRDPDVDAARCSAATRPVQVVLAGKAHPRDEEAKRTLQAPVRHEGRADRRRARRLPRRLRPGHGGLARPGLRRVAEPARARRSRRAAPAA